MFNKQVIRVLFFVFFCCLYLYFSMVKADTIRHVYYGGDCLTGKINCDGWNITIGKDNIPGQQIITTTKGTNSYQIHYDYATVADTAFGVGLLDSSLFVASAGFLGIITIPIVFPAGYVAGSFIGAIEHFKNHNKVCITDPDGIKKSAGNPECYEVSHDYIQHFGRTGNVELNYPTDGDITINGASWQEKVGKTS